MTSGFVPCCLLTCQPSCDQKITPLELSKWLFYFLLYLFFHTWIIIYDNLGTNLGTNIKHVSTVRWTVGLFLQLYIFYLYGKLDLPERLPFVRATTCNVFWYILLPTGQENVTKICHDMQRLMQSEAFPIYHSLKEDDVNRFTDKIDPVKI